MPSDQIVLDLETKKTFDEVGGRNPSELGITVVGTYFYETDQYRVFEENEVPLLEGHLSRATRIIGFNTHRFDFLVLQPYLKRLRLSDLPSLDLLEELEKILGHRVSLQSVAKATLDTSKTGSGLDAIRFYRAGEMEKLKEYCQNDVKLTREVYEFARKFGHLYYLSKDGSARMKANISWQDPEPSKNLSLF